MKRKRLPPWFRVKLESGGDFAGVREILKEERLHTVCQSARCPNVWECWSNKTATFMILGDICTRGCRFCAIEGGDPGGVIDAGEPQRVVAAVKKMGLHHVVVTSVTRDDLPDGGASVFADLVERLRADAGDCCIEVLIPDFLESVDTVLEAAPDILNHNIETVPRLYRSVRPEASYERSINLLKKSKQDGAVTKTGIMLGLGETDEEVYAVFDDLAALECDILSIGQYLQATSSHLPVEKYYTPEEFDMFQKVAVKKGIGWVESGPKVRSSYHAEKYSGPILF